MLLLLLLLLLCWTRGNTPRGCTPRRPRHGSLLLLVLLLLLVVRRMAGNRLPNGSQS
jgi:hypothetical protein